MHYCVSQISNETAYGVLLLRLYLIFFPTVGHGATEVKVFNVDYLGFILTTKKSIKVNVSQ